MHRIYMSTSESVQDLELDTTLIKNIPYFKGQLISECLFDDLNFPKNQRKIWQISALETKKWSNQQSKGTFL